MNPYDIDIKKLKESKEPQDCFKTKLIRIFLQITNDISIKDLSCKTGIKEEQLFKVQAFDIQNIDTDSIIDALDKLGFSTNISITPKEAS